MKQPRIVLASASPRRRQLLEALEVTYEVLPAGINEAAVRADTPQALVRKIAAAKAEAVVPRVSVRAGEKALVLSADTEVVLDGEVFGKPRDREHAKEMLRRLAGRTHTVHTALAIQELPGGSLWLDGAKSDVRFHPLADQTIANYVETGEADDKAGAYGLQGAGAEFIAEVRGELSTVIGLSLAALERGLRQAMGDNICFGDERGILRRAYPDLMKSLKFEIHPAS